MDRKYQFKSLGITKPKGRGASFKQKFLTIEFSRDSQRIGLWYIEKKRKNNQHQ